MKRLALVLAIGACGGGGSGTIDAPAGTDSPGTDGAIDSPPGVFALTSPSFVEGGAIPQDLSCNGAELSPQLDWVGAPAGTLSFAIVFTDLTGNPLIHSVIYDIPGNLDSLPADVEQVYLSTDVSGAKQTRNYKSASNFGYAGPCPGSAHMYEFALYALDVATLPGAVMSTTQTAAKNIIVMHDLASATLRGTYTP